MRLLYIAYVHGFRTHTSFSLRIRSFETHENITIEGKVVVLAYVRVYVSHANLLSYAQALVSKLRRRRKVRANPWKIMECVYLIAHAMIRKTRNRHNLRDDVDYTSVWMCFYHAYFVMYAKTFVSKWRMRPNERGFAEIKIRSVCLCTHAFFRNPRIGWKQHKRSSNNVVCVNFFTPPLFLNPRKHQILRQCVVLSGAYAGFLDDCLVMNAYTFFETHALVVNNTSIPEITSYASFFWRRRYF
jgi:hypothetical protein